MLLGSYNGQDSLGDECLLKCVVDQYQRAASDHRLTFALHSHRHTPLLEQLEGTLEFTANRGVQSAFWRFQGQMRHTHLPRKVYQALAAAMMPGYIAAAAALHRLDARAMLAQMGRAKLLHIFGGTNFSFQWYHLNAPYFFATSAALKLRGCPTYLSPQQYGPMSPKQLRLFKAWLRSCVSDYRARNPRCVAELGGDLNEHLTSDEVYSNRSLYPIVGERPANAEYVLLNVRGGSMSDESTFSESEMDAIADTLSRVYQELRIPYRFFAVSGAKLTEDERSYQALARRFAGRVPISNAGRVADEYELMAVAERAFACISMSFHGCILSSFMGIPSVPITNGAYYDYKYIGFDQYGDGRPVPVLPLDRPVSTSELSSVLGYLRGYDAPEAARRRELAAEKLERYYRSIVERAL